MGEEAEGGDGGSRDCDYDYDCVVVSVNSSPVGYRLLHTVALRRPMPGFVKCENNTSIVSYFGTG